jgi:SAM-dependent methyltransferase
LSASTEQRRAEHAKYVRSYEMQSYRMGERRMADAVRHLAALPRGSYLDVGCGRGEMIQHALHMGFQPCQGTEIVPALIDGVMIVRAEVHALPFADKSFDVVTMFDVIEHLIPCDDERACRELMRAARRHILITAANWPSFNSSGDQLHINCRPYQDWHRLFAGWFSPAQVTWLAGAPDTSQAWRVDL